MSSELLTRYIEAGFPHFKQMSGLPEWLVPDVTEVARKLGDQGMLELAEPLGLSDRLESFLAEAPEVDSLPIEIWQEGIGQWQAIHHVLPVAMALLRACEKIEALERRGGLVADVASIVHGLATIAYATFDSHGGKILDRLAVILGGSPAEPAALLDRYVRALENGDNDTLASIEECILQHPTWSEWTKRLLAEGMALPFMPRVIGIGPVPTSELIRLLAAMIVEVVNADRIRDTGN